MERIFATSNKGKLREASEILGDGYRLLCPADLGITEEIPETGDTLEANSLQKARYVFEKCGRDCFADDTGLEVDALGGAPGVHSARYATEGHDFEANIDKLLAELEKHPGEPRTARFRCVVTLIHKGGTHTFEGKVEGRIATERRGNEGFGYDSVFIPDELDGSTFGEVHEGKNLISHRGRSLRALARWLKENG